MFSAFRIIFAIFVIVVASPAVAANGDWCPGSWDGATLTCSMPPVAPIGTQIVVDDPGATLLGGSLTGNGPSVFEIAITVKAGGVLIEGTEIASYHTAIALESDDNTVRETRLSENLVGLAVGVANPAGSILSNDNAVLENEISTNFRFTPWGFSIGIRVFGSRNAITENRIAGMHVLDIFLVALAGMDGNNEIYGNDIRHGGGIIAVFVNSPSNLLWGNQIRLMQEGRGTAIRVVAEDNTLLDNEIDGFISGQPCLEVGDPCAPGSDGIVVVDGNGTVIEGNELIGTLRNFRGITVVARNNDVTDVQILRNTVRETAGEAIRLECNAAGISLRGARIEENSAYNTFSGVHLSDRGSQCVVGENWIVDNEFAGSFLAGISLLSFTGAITGNRFQDNDIGNAASAFGEAGVGVRLLSLSGDITDNQFSDNETNGNLGDGIVLEGTSVQDNLFDGGESNDNGGVGIHLIDASNNTFTNIEVAGNALGAVLEEGAAGGNVFVLNN